MNGIVSAACELLENKEAFVLATIVSHTGSTPRTSGSRMIVAADGRGIGTVGGGLLEAGVMSRAVELIRTGRSAVMPFDLNYETVDSLDMICGGQAEVLLDCIQPSKEVMALFHRWRRLLTERKRGSLFSIVRVVDDAVERVEHCLAAEDDEFIGSWPLGEAVWERARQAAASAASALTLPVDDGFVLVEPVQQVNTVYLFGAGHVALFTGAMAAMAGFRVSVADDREEFANRQRFPDAQEIRVLENFEWAFDCIGVGAQDYIVILTRGHLHDKTVLARALKTEAGYIGMIGSRKKRDAIYGALLKEGTTQADIDRVHSPIGLAIGAETPEEIAVSIVAEMIQHRANKRKADR
ncbi:XdhC family aldehyde oxidoreductase maturation factor [uncultured Desulfosarcina sp.]|uniref:XdhC family aldehyde oxidoreductase maturation factor n=1 Tax=uncultured Desulfosarcina sp. TaxID=218289 RepID=UPI0029C92C3A|nr:XdhC family protein [uncultured Desulfosarcina sp.]